MKVFVSLPMNGRADDTVLKEMHFLFERWCRYYSNETWDLIDSFHHDENDANKGHVQLLGESVSLMADADVVILAEHWYRARGCRIEERVAYEYDIPRYVYSSESDEFIRRHY